METVASWGWGGGQPVPAFTPLVGVDNKEKKSRSLGIGGPGWA